jgi:small multidrug resistance pump
MRSVMLLGAAALLYVIGGVAMKYSRSLTVLQPSLLLYAAFLGGATLQTIGMSGSKMGVTYVVVLGLEAVLALACAAAFLGERVSVSQLAGAILVVAGIVVLEFGE